MPTLLQHVTVSLTNESAFIGDRRSDRVVPLAGATGGYFGLYGTWRTPNQARLRELAAHPLARGMDGLAVIEAILVADPTEVDDGPAPVGVCASVGFLGSTYNFLTSQWSLRAVSDASRHRFLATRVVIKAPRDAAGKLDASAWFPVDWQAARRADGLS